MLLYLVQHAEAKKEEEDAARPLSEKGIHDIRNTALHLSNCGITVDSILHSGKLRARQTAEVLSGFLGPGKDISETEGLAPLDDPRIIEARLKGLNESLMIVGHLPHLGKLVSLLLCGDMERNLVLFRMAGAACLERDETGSWSLKWMIIPDILPALKSEGRAGGFEIYARDLGL